MRKKIAFENGTETVTLPSNLRVKNVEVVEVDGREYVNIYAEDRPVLRNQLAVVEVKRPNEPSEGGKLLKELYGPRLHEGKNE